MVIWLSYGHSPSTVGRLVGRTDRAVRKWRARWVARPCLESLLDAPRSGRPPTVPLVTRCEIVKLACERPAKSVAPFRCVFRAMAITRFGPSRSPISVRRDHLFRSIPITHFGHADHFSFSGQKLRLRPTVGATRCAPPWVPPRVR